MAQAVVPGSDPAAVPGFAGPLRAAQPAVAQQAALPFAAARVRILARVPAVRRPVVELAVPVAWPNAEQLPEALRAAAAQLAVSSFAAVRAPIPFRAPAVAQRPGAELAVQGVSPNAGPRGAAAQPDAEVAAEVARPDAAAGAAAEPDAAEAAGVGPGAAVERPGARQDVQVPAVGLPSGAVACLSPLPFVAPPRSVHTAHAMARSSVAWL